MRNQKKKLLIWWNKLGEFKRESDVVKFDESYNISSNKISNHFGNIDKSKTKPIEEYKDSNQNKIINAAIPHANITIDINDASDISHNESSVVISSRPTQIIKESEFNDTNRETLLLNRISEEGKLEDSVVSMTKSNTNIDPKFDVYQQEISKPISTNEENKYEIKGFNPEEVKLENVEKSSRPQDFYLKKESNNEMLKQVKSARQQQERPFEVKQKDKQKQKLKLQQKLKELEQLERMLAEKEMRSK